MIEPSILLTPRLRLEALCEVHADAMQTVLQDDRLYAWMPDTRFPDADGLRQRYRRLAAGSGDVEEIWLNYIVFASDALTPMGYVQATVYPARQHAELAYVLAPAYWGQGFATEAMLGLIAHLQQRHDLQTLSLQIDARNQPSLALASRLGFQITRSVTDEGTLDYILTRTLQPD
ncbi:GNAT family N-acetyltransferase [Leeia sp.]|uniref:GNAT family N-acetyltransferase n=1 Tax=Leeia sp. TaxID=2884678 RepID=UPI0035B4F2D5